MVCTNIVEWATGELLFLLIFLHYGILTSSVSIKLTTLEKPSTITCHSQQDQLFTFTSL